MKQKSTRWLSGVVRLGTMQKRVGKQESVLGIQGGNLLRRLEVCKTYYREFTGVS